ncbi:aa3-type cytochrome oxidase subunit CtaJ [Jatrophihabitans sp. DSM 45814]
MSIVETVLVFVGIPAGVFAVFAIVTLGPGAVRAPRYRPGSSWDYKPVWYLPHPEHEGPVSSLQSANTLEAGTRLAVSGAVAEPAKASGGASGEW